MEDSVEMEDLEWVDDLVEMEDVEMEDLEEEGLDLGAVLDLKEVDGI